MTKLSTPRWVHTSGFQVSHTERAREARLHPGKWVNVRSYEHYETAHANYRGIRDGAWAAYQPPGRYEARLIKGPDLWPHRPWTVYVRYTGTA